MISVLIPVKNKEKERLQKIIEPLERNPLISEVIVCDYNSSIPVELEGDKVKVVRYTKETVWNKAHCLNCAFKKSKGKWIMTLDADILLPELFFIKLEQHLKSDNFIYSKNVRRIDLDESDLNVQKMFEVSRPWTEQKNYFLEISHTGTGGVQMFPRWWYDQIKGIDENLFYYGGMDNITVVDAVKSGLNIVQLNVPIFHIDHEVRKEMNMPEEERDFAQFVRQDRPRLINSMCNSTEPNNGEGKWGSLVGPNMPLYEEYKNMFKGYKSQIKKGERIEVDTSKNLKIMVVPINNKGEYPDYFVHSLYELLSTTKKVFPNTELVKVNACDVNHLRNVAIDLALENNFDYIIQLDVDHVYPAETILRLLGHKKEFVCGLTMNRSIPQHLTQYKEFKSEGMTKDPNNVIKPNGKLQKIEATGPVGMLMKVSTLRMLPRPWFKMRYRGEPGLKFDRGGDLEFTRLLKEFGKEIYCDTGLEFPHHTVAQLNYNGIWIQTTHEAARLEKETGKKCLIPVPLFGKQDGS